MPDGSPGMRSYTEVGASVPTRGFFHHISQVGSVPHSVDESQPEDIGLGCRQPVQFVNLSWNSFCCFAIVLDG